MSESSLEISEEQESHSSNLPGYQGFTGGLADVEESEGDFNGLAAESQKLNAEDLTTTYWYELP